MGGSRVIRPAPGGGVGHEHTQTYTPPWLLNFQTLTLPSLLAVARRLHLMFLGRSASEWNDNVNKFGCVIVYDFFPPSLKCSSHELGWGGLILQKILQN